jgi:hypothetical protein
MSDFISNLPSALADRGIAIIDGNGVTGKSLSAIELDIENREMKIPTLYRMLNTGCSMLDQPLTRNEL